MNSTKIGFVLASPAANPLPSTRISVLNMLPFLRKAGYESHICFEGNSDILDAPLADRLCADGVEIAYFQKVHGPAVLREVQKLSRDGMKTIFGVCDFIDNDMARATDATIVISEYLKNLYDPELRHKIFVVHDGIERPEIQKHDNASNQTRLKAVLVTAYAPLEIPILGKPPKFVDITVVGRYPNSTAFSQRVRDSYWEIRKRRNVSERYRFVKHLINSDFKTVSWDIDGVYQVMADSDIGIIPVDMKLEPLPGQDVSSWQVRSENRLTMKMAVGLPVIASAVPSYCSVIEQGVNGYIATGREDWMELLDQLRNPAVRKSIGVNARASVIERFSKEAQARKLIAVLDKVKAGGVESTIEHQRHIHV